MMYVIYKLNESIGHGSYVTVSSVIDIDALADTGGWPFPLQAEFFKLKTCFCFGKGKLIANRGT